MDKERKISRRDFLKIAGLGTAASLMVLADVEALTSPYIPKLKTDNADFYFLYELHSNGPTDIDYKKVLPHTDILWKEGTIFSDDPKNPNAKNLLYQITPEQLTSAFFLSKRFIENTPENINIAYGDISVPPSINSFVKNLKHGIDFSALFLFIYTHRNHYGRRDFLKTASEFGFAACYLPTITSLGLVATEATHTQGIVKRGIEKLNGFESQLNPQDTILFFRNIFMADKLLEVAKLQKQQTGKKQNISLNLGAGHAGIEEHLSLGQNFCRQAINAYPNEFIKEVINLNGNSIEDICTTRIINLRKSQNRILAFEKERIIDQGLVQLVTKKAK